MTKKSWFFFVVDSFRSVVTWLSLTVEAVQCLVFDANRLISLSIFQSKKKNYQKCRAIQWSTWICFFSQSLVCLFVLWFGVDGRRQYYISWCRNVHSRLIISFFFELKCLPNHIELAQITEFSMDLNVDCCLLRKE